MAEAESVPVRKEVRMLHTSPACGTGPVPVDEIRGGGRTLTRTACASSSDAPPLPPPPPPPAQRAAVVLLHLLITHPSHPPRWDDLIRPLELLHGRLALLATADPPLAALAAACFELAWRADAPGREALVAQTLPYLVALALTSASSARPVLRRLFALRDALQLLDHDDDESISDFKMLLRGAELELARCRNAELEGRQRQRTAEGQAWVGVVRSHEAVTTWLRATLDQLLQQPACNLAGAGGDNGEAEDAQSCCFDTSTLRGEIWGRRRCRPALSSSLP